IDDFVSDTPPDPYMPETTFEPYVWFPHLGVGTRNYNPRLSEEDGSRSRPNDPDYPLGLGIIGPSVWRNVIRNTMNTNTTEEPEILYDVFDNQPSDSKDRYNMNDYFGGYNLVDTNGNRLTQLLDERHRL